MGGSSSLSRSLPQIPWLSRMVKKSSRRTRRSRRKTRRLRRRRKQRGGDPDGFNDLNTVVTKTINGVPTVMSADKLVNDPNGLEAPAPDPDDY
jgi:hypothetical protein